MPKFLYYPPRVVPYQYVWVNITTASHWRLGELEFYPDANLGGTKLTGTAITSGGAGGASGNTAFAFDGNTNSDWTAAGSTINQYLGLELSAASAVKSARIFTNSNSSNTPATMEIRASNAAPTFGTDGIQIAILNSPTLNTWNNFTFA